MECGVMILAGIYGDEQGNPCSPFDILNEIQYLSGSEHMHP